MVNTYWDGKQGRFKSHWELLREREIADEKALTEQGKKPAFVVPRNIVDDWTGQRFLEPCYGAYPCPLPKEERDKKALVQLDAEVEAPPNRDPMDPNLADVDNIIQRLKKRMLRKKLKNQELSSETIQREESTKLLLLPSSTIQEMMMLRSKEL